MVIKINKKNQQISIPIEMLDLYSIKVMGDIYKNHKKEMNIKLREIYNEEEFSTSKEIQDYIAGEILMQTQVAIIRNKKSVTVNDRLLDKVSMTISNNKFSYMENKPETNQAIRNFFIKNCIKDSKHLNSQLMNFFLDRKLKEQVHQKNFEEMFDMIHYSLADLKKLCEKNNYNLVLTDSEIGVYPVKDDEIAKDIPFLKEILHGFGADDESFALKSAVDYIYKELIFLEKS